MNKFIVVILIIILGITIFFIDSEGTEADVKRAVSLQLTEQEIRMDEPVQLQIKVTDPAIQELQFKLPEGLQVVEKETQIDKLTIDETTQRVTLTNLEPDNTVSMIAIKAGEYHLQAQVIQAKGVSTSNAVKLQIAEKKLSDKVTIAKIPLTTTEYQLTNETTTSLPNGRQKTNTSPQVSETSVTASDESKAKQPRIIPPAVFNNENNPPFSELDVGRSFHIVSGKNSSIHPTNKSQAIITENKKSQIGGMWYKKKLDLTEDFDLKMAVYLGDNPQGADGMTFVIQNDARGLEAIGEAGAGIGVYNTKNGEFIKNAVALEFDTFYNTGTSSGTDRFVNNKAKNRGHIAVQIPSEKNGNTATDHRGLQIATENNQILANDTWRTLHVTWNATTKIISYSFENYTPIHYQVEDIEKTFGGTMAYWGFTGSTGTYTNFNSASIIKLPGQNKVEFSKSVKNMTSGGVFTDAATVAVSDKVRYRLKVTNSIKNHFESLNVLVSDELDKRLAFEPGSFTINGKAMTDSEWNNGQILLGTVQPGESFDIQFDAKVKATGKITNKARYQAEHEMSYDTNVAVIQTGQLQIEKKDGDSHQPLAGVTYRLNKADGSLLAADLVTDNSGSITVEKLLPGNYSLTETKAAPGYLIDKQKHQFTIKEDQADGPTQLKLVNYRAPQPQLTLTANRVQAGYQSSIEYTLTASLPKGSGNWKKIVVEAELPAFLTFVAGDEAPLVEGQKIRWSVGDLRAGEQKQLKFSARVTKVPPTEIMTNKASATGVDSNGHAVEPIIAAVDIQYAGQLTLTAVPTALDFGRGLTSQTQTNTYPLQTYDAALIVTDTRIKRNNWMLSVKMKQQLHGEKVELANAIHFEKESGKLMRVTAEDTPIYMEHSQTIETVLSDRWTKTGSGFKLVIPGGKGAAGDYAGILSWTLIDAPQ